MQIIRTETLDPSQGLTDAILEGLLTQNGISSNHSYIYRVAGSSALPELESRGNVGNQDFIKGFTSFRFPESTERGGYIHEEDDLNLGDALNNVYSPMLVIYRTSEFENLGYVAGWEDCYEFRHRGVSSMVDTIEAVIIGEE
ncbi:hypothetical protein HOC80_03090 [archaeon]|jgi:hypothetical protein|nr:hypothetical protein [archaeon]MBT4417065.1 hypothetical protein [archaeon]